MDICCIVLEWCHCCEFPSLSSSHPGQRRYLGYLGLRPVLPHYLQGQSACDLPVHTLTHLQDYTMGFALSILTAALGVGQFFTRAIAFQWIFAFIIMAILFLATLVIAIPGIFGKEVSFRRDQNVVSADQERAPLLDDH
jgi:hypothetical protein